MKAKSLTDQDGKQSGYTVSCPGCSREHYIAVEQPLSNGAKWTFNNDLEKPTFSPSLLLRWGKKFESRCHSFIREGKIQYLSDCTHKLAGQTVNLPDLGD